MISCETYIPLDLTVELNSSFFRSIVVGTSIIKIVGVAGDDSAVAVPGITSDGVRITMRRGLGATTMTMGKLKLRESGSDLHMCRPQRTRHFSYSVRVLAASTEQL